MPIVSPLVWSWVSRHQVAYTEIRLSVPLSTHLWVRDSLASAVQCAVLTVSVHIHWVLPVSINRCRCEHWNTCCSNHQSKAHQRNCQPPTLLRESKNRPYAKQLDYWDLPTLIFRKRTGDMIETYKLLTNNYDNRTGLPSLQFSTSDCTRGNDMKLDKIHVRYDIRELFSHTG